MKRHLWMQCLLWISLVPCIPAAHAQTQAGVPALAQIPDPDKDKPEDTSYMSRFVPFEPSHAIYQRAQNDEKALNARYSFRYSLLSSEPKHMPCRAATPGKPVESDCLETFFAYTGEFDFYVRSRDSGPVINRVSNPALHVRWRDREGSYFDVGFEHRSNGQVLEPQNPQVMKDAARAYAVGDHAYFDGISRGSNYVSFELRKQISRYSFTGNAKYYATQDGDVTWGPDAIAKPKLSDYDRVRFNARAFVGPADLGIEWIVGDKGLRTDSWNADVSYVLGGLPLYVRYHHGPMRTLSNYTVSQNSLGFGLKFLSNPWARERNNSDGKNDDNKNRP